MDPGCTFNVYALRPEARLWIPCRIPFKDLSIIIYLQFFVQWQFETLGRKKMYKKVLKS